MCVCVWIDGWFFVREAETIFQSFFVAGVVVVVVGGNIQIPGIKEDTC